MLYEAEVAQTELTCFRICIAVVAALCFTVLH